jgi:tetratricopeptide (TPR) repeat protein
MTRFSVLLLATLGLVGSSRSLAGQDSTASRARQLAASGDFRQAATTWRRVLEAQPDDRSALAGLVDALEAAGDWRNAIAPLDRLLELGPSDPARLRQRGVYAAWSGDLERGIGLLRRAVAQSPENPVYLAALARALSWSPATRGEASRRFVEALRYDPTSVEVVVGYADLLSWTPGTRDSAGALYRRVLSRRPDEPRARVGLANLLAWEGKPAQALRSYDSVLADLPDNVDALRGRGGALNQLGRHGEAMGALQRALELAPGDAAAAGELARAELGSGRYRSARARLTGRVDPMLRGVADSARRATASAAEVSGLVRRRKNQLDLNGVSARATGAVGSVKLHGDYERSEFTDGGAGFRSDGYGGGARIDHRGLAVLAAARVRSIQGLDSHQWDGALQLGWSIGGGVSLGVGGSRASVEESRRAVQSDLDGGQLRGAVHANLAHLTLVLDRLPGPFDAEAMIQAGHYTGLGLESNRRVAVDTRIGLIISGSQPWVRIGYGFAASQFDYNADLGFAQVPTRRGGYFSPAQYWRHQGILQVSERLGSRIHWDADARMGREWARQLEGTTATSRNTAAVNTTLTIRVASGLDLEARFLYVNAFDAFEMKEFATVLKVYFP